MYSQNDWRDYLAHNWGNSPKMKSAEKIYNAKYYQEHKAKILARAKERAGDIAESAKNAAGKAEDKINETAKDIKDRYGDKIYDAAGGKYLKDEAKYKKRAEALKDEGSFENLKRTVDEKDTMSDREKIRIQTAYGMRKQSERKAKRSRLKYELSFAGLYDKYKNKKLKK